MADQGGYDPNYQHGGEAYDHGGYDDQQQQGYDQGAYTGDQQGYAPDQQPYYDEQGADQGGYDHYAGQPGEYDQQYAGQPREYDQQYPPQEGGEYDQYAGQQEGYDQYADGTGADGQQQYYDENGQPYTQDQQQQYYDENGQPYEGQDQQYYEQDPNYDPNNPNNYQYDENTYGDSVPDVLLLSQYCASAIRPRDDSEEALMEADASWEPVREWLRTHSVEDVRAATEQRDDSQKTALHFACQFSPPIDVIEVFLSVGLDIVQWEDA